MAEMLVVQAKVKELAQKTEEGIRIGDGFMEALSATAENQVKAAIARCKATGRQTLRAEDL